jgi:hypothetical protein
MAEVKKEPVVTHDAAGEAHYTFGPDHSISDICRWLCQTNCAEEAHLILGQMLSGTYDKIIQ